MIKQIATVETGQFIAWFDKVENHFEIQWYDQHNPKGFSFRDLETAKEFWHEQVIERKQINHCPCC